MAHPKGESFVSHTKTLLMGGFCPSAIKPSHIGEGLDRVDASFSSFLRAEEKDKTLMAHPVGA
jgi:hypothetical protein